MLVDVVVEVVGGMVDVVLVVVVLDVVTVDAVLVVVDVVVVTVIVVVVGTVVVVVRVGDVVGVGGWLVVVVTPGMGHVRSCLSAFTSRCKLSVASRNRSRTSFDATFRSGRDSGRFTLTR